jgi:serine/threonine protein kinase
MGAFKSRFRPFLELDLPTENVFFHYEEEDKEKGSLYYPASLFYKLYNKKEKLGEGASAIVRKYLKIESGEFFAVKTIRNRDGEIFSQIKNEFKNLRRLNHPNIIRALELYNDEEKGKIFYLMEFQEGQTLSSKI